MKKKIMKKKENQNYSEPKMDGSGKGVRLNKGRNEECVEPVKNKGYNKKCSQCGYMKTTVMCKNCGRNEV